MLYLPRHGLFHFLADPMRGYITKQALCFLNISKRVAYITGTEFTVAHPDGDLVLPLTMTETQSPELVAQLQGHIQNRCYCAIFALKDRCHLAGSWIKER